MPTEEDRRYLFDEIARTNNDRAASILMEYLPPVGWAEVATKTDLGALRAELKGDLAEVKGEIARLGGRIEALPARIFAGNFAMLIGLAGVIFGAIALFR